jgi:predicted dehydrogenase
MRAGIVGAGFIGVVHAQAVRATGGVVAATVGRTPETTARAVAVLGAERGVASVAELAAADDVDVVLRGPDTFGAAAAPYSRLPAGHPQGYQDAFTAFVADTYAAIAGQEPDGLPTFADGLRAAVLTEAVLAAAAEQTWVKVPLG